MRRCSVMRVLAALVAVVALVCGREIPANDRRARTSVDSHSKENSYAPRTGYHKEKKCEETYEEVLVDKCEPYVNRVCTTSHVEHCDDVKDRNCRGIVASSESRQCFNVSELICGLREHVSYEVVQAVFTVQKCHKTLTRVCDTVYDTQTKPKDVFQCITTNNPYCKEKEETVLDKTCRHEAHFECPENHGKIIQGKHEYKCKKTYHKHCYETPRVVSWTTCDRRQQRVCDKLTEQVVYPVEKQVCHDEYKKVCELHQRKKPKQVKKYNYSDDCRAQPRTVCDNSEVKKLVESCVPVTRKSCKFSPVEKCEDVKKEHCRKIVEHVKKQKCEE